jgi:hypothetical protein
MTWASMSRALSQRASQNPSRPASKATAQRLALDARHNAGDEPARQAQFDNGDQRAVRIEGARRSAQIVQLLHGGRSIGSRQQRWIAISSPPPHSISFGGFRTPATSRGVRGAVRHGPASENLHNLVVLSVRRSLPVYSGKQTSSRPVGTSHLSQYSTRPSRTLGRQGTPFHATRTSGRNAVKLTDVNGFARCRC